MTNDPLQRAMLTIVEELAQVSNKDKTLLLRQALLMAVDTLERVALDKDWLHGPRTAELRQQAKRGRQ